jgi:hypothetical protein
MNFAIVISAGNQSQKTNTGTWITLFRAQRKARQRQKTYAPFITIVIRQKQIYRLGSIDRFSN